MKESRVKNCEKYQRIDPRNSMSNKKINIIKSTRYIIIKCIKTMMKRIFTIAEKKRQDYRKKTIATYFSPETMQTRK